MGVLPVIQGRKTGEWCGIKRARTQCFMKEENHCRKPVRKMLEGHTGFGNKTIISDSTKSICTGVLGADARLAWVEE